MPDSPSTTRPSSSFSSSTTERTDLVPRSARNTRPRSGSAATAVLPSRVTVSVPPLMGYAREADLVTVPPKSGVLASTSPGAPFPPNPALGPTAVGGSTDPPMLVGPQPTRRPTAARPTSLKTHRCSILIHPSPAEAHRQPPTAHTTPA